MKGKPSGEWRHRHIKGLPRMSRQQRDVLVYLRDVGPLAQFSLDPRTLRALLRNAWVDVTPDHCVALNAEGRRVLTLYLERPPKRGDDICPRCGVAPVHYLTTGARVGYCAPCAKAMVAARQTAGSQTRAYLEQLAARKGAKVAR